MAAHSPRLEPTHTIATCNNVALHIQSDRVVFTPGLTAQDDQPLANRG